MFQISDLDRATSGSLLSYHSRWLGVDPDHDFHHASRCVEPDVRRDIPGDAGILDIYLKGNAPMVAAPRTDLLGGVHTINAEVLIREHRKSGVMYHQITSPSFTKQNIQMVPYYAWSNRGTAEMSVFFPVHWDI